MSPPRAPKASDGFLNLTGFEWRDEYLGRYLDAGCDGVLVGPGSTGEMSDLAFLAMLPGLRSVSCMRGVVDCSDVVRLAGLRELHLPVDYAGPLPLGELPDLEKAEQSVLSRVRGGYCALDGSAQPHGVVLAQGRRTTVGDGDFAPLFSIPKLRSVGIERGASNYSHKPAEIRANFPPG
jgi:hypothetical protein